MDFSCYTCNQNCHQNLLNTATAVKGLNIEMTATGLENFIISYLLQMCLKFPVYIYKFIIHYLIMVDHEKRHLDWFPLQSEFCYIEPR